jgi:hypothetical protein
MRDLKRVASGRNAVELEAALGVGRHVTGRAGQPDIGTAERCVEQTVVNRPDQRVCILAQQGRRHESQRSNPRQVTRNLTP